MYVVNNPRFQKAAVVQYFCIQVTELKVQQAIFLDFQALDFLKCGKYRTEIGGAMNHCFPDELAMCYVLGSVF